ncbi:MAG: PQQ-binding-like beta-propeller repeat protein [Candidatus Aenigmatarchaeota archaeon]
MASMVFVSGCVRQPGQNPNGTAAGPEGGQPGGSQAGNGTEGFRMPMFDATKPLRGPPVTGDNKTLMLGDIEIKYYSVAASYPTFSMGADFFMHVRNTDASAETFSIIQASKPPSWNMHFLAFHPESITLRPGEERTLHYFSSNDAEGQFGMDFDIWQKPDKSDKVTARVTFYSGSQDESKLDYDAVLYGYVLDNSTGKPVPNANVEAFLFTGRESFNERTDSEGRYALPTVSEEAIKAFFGSQETSYASLVNFVTVDADGYEYSYTGGVSAKRGEKLRLDIRLDPRKPAQTYKLDWEQKVSDYYGFFWALVDSNWSRIVASQAKHPPEIGKPTNFYLFDAKTGAQLWKYPTGDECWGIDISRDGTVVAAGCHDNYVYVVNAADGTLKWKYDSGGMNREVELSHDGKWLVTGPSKAANGGAYDFALFKVADGTLVRGFGGQDSWLRNSKFTADGSRFVVGLAGGYTAMYDTASGDKIWENYIGEFPLFLAIDANENTYATGKGRTLFSFDAAGNTRWSLRMPDHTAGTGGISADGSRVAVGTVGGWVYYIDGANGKILWRARAKGGEIESTGHNGVSISADGKYVAVGYGPDNMLVVYNEHGSAVFDVTEAVNTDPVLDEKWSTIGTTSSKSSQRAVMCTYTSADGGIIIAAYGDDYVRAFSRQ